MKRLAALAAIFALGLDVGCKKPASTEPPTPEPAPPVEAAPPGEPEVPQEPDPPELALVGDAYLAGHHDAARQTLEPLLEDLKARKQWRASGLAAGWLALIHAEHVFEHAREPAEYAMSMAQKTDDPEVDAMAQLAWGTYLLGNQDFDAALQSLEQAMKAGQGTKLGVIAQLEYAEALINRAFGRLGEELEHPEDLERARRAYAEAGTAAQRFEDNILLLGRVEEGKAALADFRKLKPEVCAHALAAYGHYERAQASEERLFLPEKLIDTYKCQRPQQSPGNAGSSS